MTNQSNVRAVERAFRVLQIVNTRDGVSPSEIAQATEIPRPTVYRLLETMEQLRFVVRDQLTNKWRVALHTKSLSSGFRDADWVCQVAIPEMVSFGKRILWPVDLMVFQNDHMEIRESTYYLSPYSLDRGMVGTQLPLQDTASGRAYLLFSPDKQRDDVLERLKARSGSSAPLMTPDGSLDQVLDQCRELGVGFRKRGFRVNTMSIAAPIMTGENVLACITIIWLRSALDFDEAVKLYRDPLLRLAERISESISDQGDESLQTT
ncbi:MAG: helix-turn-helix domain-containing protein [Oricola sp.]|nr:helix-turn-helix domain-containing protein [Oricola sp.]